ncbi:hypothetical protein PHMEG_00013012 [Phytophthora megakarya]|uniref:RNase H type-1 domain-containing protein n=1 Tax=Phytophthora megakarya TaxID=4795 RepID=A0A225W8V0_9STRA|nr:hypothetical protein PHMEG_00013012 [Phytophthora megakarya]
MISLDLGRKLKLKLNRQNQVKLSGLGGIPTQVTASAEVKITLGSRLVYIVEFWVANIGEGLDVLLGMDFMFRAGVRVCVREGLVQLPDEESILMYDENVKVSQGVDLPVMSLENLYPMPGEHAVVRIQLRYWNISVSLPKSEFGKRTIPYLPHAISAEGIRATPKIAKGVQDLLFPTTMKGVQSFLGSLNYCHKFIEDYPVIAASLYEISDDQWNLDVRKIQRDEDGLAAILGAGITPREHLDEVAEELIPAKERAIPPPIISVEMLEDTFEGIVLSFDGAAKTSTRQCSCGCILWELPGWNILDAQGFIPEDVTVNDAEYGGLLNSLTMVQARGVRDPIAVGDSRIVIQQVQGLINCN